MEAGNFSLINWGGSLVGCREKKMSIGLVRSRMQRNSHLTTLPKE
jgi:hypothetical protein